MSLKEIVGPELMKALDVIGEDDNSAVIRVEISSGSWDDPVPVCHEFFMRVLDGEWQESSHHERHGTPTKPAKP